MKSLIFATASRYLLPLLLLFSLFILIRGHNEPGGGFVGGLIASISFVLYALANGFHEARKILRIHPGFIMPPGLLLMLLSGLLPMFAGEPYMTAIWYDYPLPVIGKIGTPLLFDVGVYIAVQGAALTIIFTISETI